MIDDRPTEGQVGDVRIDRIIQIGDMVARRADRGFTDDQLRQAWSSLLAVRVRGNVTPVQKRELDRLIGEIDNHLRRRAR